MALGSATASRALNSVGGLEARGGPRRGRAPRPLGGCHPHTHTPPPRRCISEGADGFWGLRPQSCGPTRPHGPLRKSLDFRSWRGVWSEELRMNFGPACLSWPGERGRLRRSLRFANVPPAAALGWLAFLAGERQGISSDGPPLKGDPLRSRSSFRDALSSSWARATVWLDAD